MPKTYNTTSNVGKARHVVNFHDGEKRHPDGSPFYDIKICRNRRELSKFVAKLESGGYVLDSDIPAGEAGEHPTCSHCGSADVRADAYASWNHELQQWELCTTFDKGHVCEACEGECSIAWKKGSPPD